MTIKGTFAPLLRRVRHFWHSLTEPSAAIHPHSRREAQLLASFLVFYIISNLIILVLGVIVAPDLFRWPEPHFILFASILVILVLPYGLSRTRFYKLAAYLTLLLITITMFIAANNEPDILDYLVIPAVMSTVFFSAYTSLLFVGTVTFITVMIPALIRQETLGSAVVGPLAFILTTSLLMIVLARRRELMDAQTQIQIMESEANFRHLFASNPLPMWVHDPQTLAFLSVNEATVNCYGYPQKELIGQPVTLLWTPDEAHTLMTDMLNARRALALPHQWVHRRKDGTCLDVELTPHAVDFAGNVAVLVVAQDMTQRNEAQKQTLDLAIEKERVNILTNFIHDASHDFRTPLMSINLSTYLLKKVTEPTVRDHHLQKIDDQVVRMVESLEEMLTMSRLDGGTSFVFKPIVLHRLVQEAFTQVASTIEAKQITLIYQLDPTINSVNAAEDELGMALLHLALNAASYTPSGGVITVATKCAAPWVRIEIRDTGPGIRSADMPHIFERFYRVDKTRSRDTGGAGLGLSIAKSIVERHQGKIEVESTEGQGSLFCVLLPCSPTSA